MQLTSIILPIIGMAAAVQAAPAPQSGVPGKSTSIPTFTISNFSNSGSPHSAQVSISFDLKSNPFGYTAKCFATHPIGAGSAGSKGPQANVATPKYYTECKSNQPGKKNGFGFVYEPKTNTFLLSVTQWTGGNTLSGSISFPNKIKTRVDKINPNGNYNYLESPKTFDILSNLPVYIAH
ncbi:hypothetical protein TWF173_005433 [Orbilia oligospora]|uniref:Uncharacterized protein n=1 Tax=Orbilia oligospora TaxID=2813651 RepID=A0A7C8VAF2_ORBOL|nr:hypothetical protein TWF970_008864 [Orbilia oligospora]KAF3319028.1 hypothetical protein TWF173_005433 [Orbilia oligospora]